jgi:hypothetical protein
MSRAPRASIQTELGEEVQCAKCREFWPADPEFYFFSKGKPHSWCKACYLSDPNIVAKIQRGIERRSADHRQARGQGLFTGLQA